MNIVVIRGTLSRAPQSRALPSGDELVGLDVTVRPETGPAESVNVAWFDPPRWAADLDEGVEVVVTGRVRRRFFRAGGATVSRTEVVAERVMPARQVVRVAKALARIADQVSP